MSDVQSASSSRSELRQVPAVVLTVASGFCLNVAAGILLEDSSNNSGAGRAWYTAMLVALALAFAFAAMGLWRLLTSSILLRLVAGFFLVNSFFLGMLAFRVGQEHQYARASLLVIGAFGSAAFAQIALYWPRYRTRQKRRELVMEVHRLSGLETVFPLVPSDPRTSQDSGQYDAAAQEAATFVRQYVQAEADEAAFTLRLLLCSGRMVLGSETEQGWLADTIERNHQSIRLEVLLLDPDSNAAATRAKNIYGDLEKLRHTTWATICHLEALSRKHPRLSIDTRLYSEEPVWQFISTKHYIITLMSVDWFDIHERSLRQSPQAADREHLYRSPVYVFNRSLYSIGWGLEAVWWRRWLHGNTTKVADLPDERRLVPDSTKLLGLI